MLLTNSTLSQGFTSITPASSESDIEQNIIIPLLDVLGYNAQDWREQMVIRKVRVDFCVHPHDAVAPHLPYLVIEVKAPHKKIVYSSWQIHDYMRKSGATLGLLTNGYEFRILYNYSGDIHTILTYSQSQLIQDFELVHKLLGKKIGLKFSQALHKSQQKVQARFLRAIANSFQDPTMLGLFKPRKKPNSEPPKPSGENLDQPKSKFIANSNQENKSMIITVFNNKGGVGKTTMTINLGAALNHLGYNVLLIDIDGQANLTMGLGIDPLEDIENQGKKDITDLLLNPRVKLEDTVIEKQWGNLKLHLVPSHIKLISKEPDLVSAVDSDRVLAKKLKNHNYDFVLIDPPPSFSKVNGISLMASSGILIPTQLSPYPVRALEYVIEKARKVGESKEEALPILGIAVSMYDQRSSSFNLSMRNRIFEILDKIGEQDLIELFPEHTWVPRLNIVSNCPDKGYPIFSSEFDNQLTFQEKEAAQKASERYLDLAQHLVKVSKIGD
jgi:cellulose biosynthesis protein BcsQ